MCLQNQKQEPVFQVASGVPLLVTILIGEGCKMFKIITGCSYIALRDITIEPNDVQNHVTKMKNWKALGPDVVQGFWFKGISNLHEAIVKPLKACLVSGKVSPWMTKMQMMDHGKQRISH